MAEGKSEAELGEEHQSRVFVWAWGRLGHSHAEGESGETNASIPKLIQSIEASTLKCIDSNAKQIVATSGAGDVYLWGELPREVTVHAAVQDHDGETSFRKLIQDDETSLGGAQYSACDRQYLYTVSQSGGVCQWPLEKDDEATSQKYILGGDDAGPLKTPWPVHIDTVVGSQRHSISRLSCGSGFCLALSSSGRVFTWGRGSHGRLGHGTSDSHEQPKMIEDLQHLTILRIACGWAHSLAVSDDGEVFSWGCGLSGRLGLGHTADISVPTPVSTLSQRHVVDVACGYHHSLVRDAKGVVFSWGGNDKGQLGLGHTRPSSTPSEVDHLSSDQCQGLSCGAFHSAAMMSDGALFTWGWGKHGQLGHADNANYSLPREVEGLTGMGVTRVCCGGEFTVAVTDYFMILHQNHFKHRNSLSRSTSGVVVSPKPQHIVTEPEYIAPRPGSPPKPFLPLVSNKSGLFPGVVPSGKDQRTEEGEGAAVDFTQLQALAWRIIREKDPKLVKDRRWRLRSVKQSVVASEIVKWFVDKEVCPDENHGVALGRCMQEAEILVPFQEKAVFSNQFLYFTFNMDMVRRLHIRATNLPSNTGSRSNSPGSGPNSLSNIADAHHNSAGALSPRTSYLNSGKRNSIPVIFSETTDSPLSPARDKKSSSNIASELKLPSAKQTSPRHREKAGTGLLDLMFNVLPDKLKKRRSRKKEGDGAEFGEDERNQVQQRLQEASVGAPARIKNQDPTALSLNYRPSNLPPKSDKEAAKHRKEVDRMNKQYKDKLKKEARRKALRREKERQQQELKNKELKDKAKASHEREAQLDAATNEWLKQIVPNWGSEKYQVRARDIVWRVGIPPQVRGKIWPICIGNTLMITPELFNIFGMHAKNARENKSAAAALKGPEQQAALAMAEAEEAKLPGKEGTFSYIDVDLSRTFPHLAFFQQESQMNEQLRNILETFCFYRPDIGYVQGMSYLAGNLLLYMNPFQAFVCFANLLNSPFFHAFLKLNPDDMRSRFEMFEGLLKEHVPKVYSHLQAENVTPDLYFMEWCMTLFCKRLALDVVGRVWDCYLVFGESFVYRVAVAVLKCLEPDIVSGEFASIMKLLQTRPGEITEKQLFAALGPIKLSQTSRQRLMHIIGRKK